MTIQKPTLWIGSSRDDLRAFPDEVRRVMGFAINDAQNGVHNVKSQVLYEIWRLFRQEGIQIPYPKRDLYAFNVPVRNRRRI